MASRYELPNSSGLRAFAMSVSTCNPAALGPAWSSGSGKTTCARYRGLEVPTPGSAFPGEDSRTSTRASGGSGSYSSTTRCSGI